MFRFAPHATALLITACGAAPVAPGATGRAPAPPTPTAADASAPVSLVFDRRLPVGLVLQHDVQAEIRDATVTKRDGKVVEEQVDVSRVRFVADGRVTAVDSTGRVSTLEYVVHDLAELGPTEAHPLLASGSKMRILFHDGALTVEVDAAPASIAVRRAVESFIDGVRSPFVEEAIFGAPGPQRPGQSWSIRAASLARTLNDSQRVSVEESSVGGKVTFAALDRSSGIECARVESEFRVPVLKLDGLPKSATLEKAEVVGRASALLPIDRSAPPVGSTVTLASEARVQVTTEKGPATMETIRVRFQDVLFRPTPAALVGQPAPELDATLLYSGERPALKSYAGKSLLVVFWSRDCLECWTALAIAKRWSDAGRPALAILLPRAGSPVEVETARSLVAAQHIDVPVAIGTSALAQRYRALSLPSTVLIDASQRLVAARVGVLTDAEYQRLSLTP